jgi:hypothetical protein
VEPMRPADGTAAPLLGPTRAAGATAAP